MAARELLDAGQHPDGYNLGINCGTAAGQSVPHVHYHLIPRYQGDMENPRGGVRGVIPDRQKYQLQGHPEGHKYPGGHRQLAGANRS